MEFGCDESHPAAVQRDERTRMANPERDDRLESFARVLHEELYLRKVFDHLLDYGLHECRRVCRKWRQVCDEMGVRLSLDKDENIHRATRGFPNAAALRIGVSVPNFPTATANHEADEQNDVFFQRILEMPRLRSLDVALKPANSQLVQPQGEDDPTERVCFLLDSLVRLTSLSISLAVVTVAYDSLFSCIRGLSCLTRLCLCKSGHVARNPVAEPITELQSLRELDINAASLLTAANVFVFRCSGLTKLKLHGSFHAFPVDAAHAFIKGVCAHLSGLRSLEDHSCEVMQVSAQWSDLLNRLSDLESLAMSADLWDRDTFRTISGLTRLTKLVGFNVVGDEMLDVARSVGWPSGLERLELESDWVSETFFDGQYAFDSLANLSRLTFLSFKMDRVALPLGALTNLRHLGGRLDPLWSGMARELPRLSALESLSLEFGQENVESAEDYTGGSTVSVRRSGALGLFEETLRAVASLRRLTTLTVAYLGSEPAPCSVFVHLSQLTRLENLCISMRCTCLLLGMGFSGRDDTPLPLQSDFLTVFDEGSFQRLKYLALASHRPARKQDTAREELFRRFPSLRRVVVGDSLSGEFERRVSSQYFAR